MQHILKASLALCLALVVTAHFRIGKRTADDNSLYKLKMLVQLLESAETCEVKSRKCERLIVNALNSLNEEDVGKLCETYLTRRSLIADGGNELNYKFSGWKNVKIKNFLNGKIEDVCYDFSSLNSDPTKKMSSLL